MMHSDRVIRFGRNRTMDWYVGVVRRVDDSFVAVVVVVVAIDAHTMRHPWRNIKNVNESNIHPNPVRQSMDRHHHDGPLFGGGSMVRRRRDATPYRRS